MPEYPRKLKPLFMLIKVEVDPEIVYNTPKAHTYAQNHCDKFEYELVDYHSPSEYNGELLSLYNNKEMEYNAFIESNKAAYTKLLNRYNKI